jgi:fructose-bisphosphate aldolase class I
MFKLSLPDEDDFYKEIIQHPQVMRVVALSGGYSREEAVDKLERNHNLIASFSRALLEGLDVSQSDEEFNNMIKNSIEKIYKASIS